MGKVRRDSAASPQTPSLGPLPVIAIGLALLGVILGAFGLYLHQQIASSHGDYASFCDINQELSCDAVLGSSYAVFLGAPVASWGILGWLIALGISIWTFLAEGRERITRATYLLAISGAILSVSLYYLAVSVVLIGVFCPICLSLDAAALGLFAISLTQVKLLEPGAPKSWAPRPVLVGAGAATLLALGALYLGQAAPAPALNSLMTVEQIRREDPRFYAYYTAQKAGQNPVPPGASVGDAEIAIVEFSDFQCPYCRTAFFNLERALVAEKGAVVVHHRNFPLNPECNSQVQSGMHPLACEAAYASSCAHAAGQGHAFDRAIFAGQSSLQEDSFGEIAEGLEMDRGVLAECMQSAATRDAVQVDLAAGRALGITSTPTFFINGRMLRRAPTPQQFLYAFAIERDLQQRQKANR